MDILNEEFLRIGHPEFVTNPSSLGTVPLLKKVLSDKLKDHVIETYAEGFTSKDLPYFSKKMKSKKGKLLYHYIGSESQIVIWIWDNSIISFNMGESYLRMHCLSTEPNFVSEIKEMVDSVLEPEIKKGHVFSIVKRGPSLTLSNIGNAGLSLCKENYSKSVLFSYHESIIDLNSSTPSGRVVILEGPPGTGKTHLIKSFLLEVPDAMFVLVPPDLLAELAGPDLLPVLMDNKTSYNHKGPLVLILEDADRCLVKRDGKNMNSIQSLLNLSDGILGSLLDLRIIATTNASKLEIEEAILRPGRLSQRIEVGLLSPKEAISLYKKLVPKKSISFNEHKSLAEIYSLARKDGWKPSAKKSS